MNEQEFKYSIVNKVILFSYMRPKINLLTKLYSHED